MPPRPAQAACDQSASIVTCIGTTTNYDAGTQAGLTVTVQPGTTVQGVGGVAAISITNPSFFAGDTLTNNGTIDGLVDIVSATAGIDTFTNNGVLKITDPATTLTSHSLFGTTFTQTANGTFMARVDAAGFNDSILAYAANLAGHLVIVVQPGLYTGPTTYTVVTTLTGITGGFDTAAVTSPFFSMAVASPADVTLTPIPFNAVPGLTPNQQAVADVLQGAYAAGTPTGTLATFYSDLFASSSVGVFDQMSGAGAAAAQDASFGAAGLFNDAMTQQGLAWLSGAPDGNGSGPPLQYAAKGRPHAKAGRDAFAAISPRRTPAPSQWRAWALGFGSTQDLAGGAGVADQTIRSAGGAIGAQRETGDWLLGFAVGGSGSHFSVSNLSTSGQVDGGHVGGYLAKRWGKAYAVATLNYTRFDNSIDRTISGIGTTENAHGHFASDQLGSRLEIGWREPFSGYAVTPFVAVAPAALWQAAYTETATVAGGGAGTLGLSYAARETTSLPSFVGAQIDARLALPGGQFVRPFLRASWVHEFMTERQVEAGIVSIPTPSFTVDGARPARDAARIDAGATLSISELVQIFANIDSEVSGGNTLFAGAAGARVTW